MADKPRASTSFTEDEVKVLDFIFRRLLQNQSPEPKIILGAKAFPKLAQKVIRMRQRIEEVKRPSVPAAVEPAVALQDEDS